MKLTLPEAMKQTPTSETDGRSSTEVLQRSL